ncbi:MAG: DNA-directed RNA polymerase subunit G [Acidilobaceae archaeon]
MVEVNLKAKITSVRPGLIRGQSIATAEYEKGVAIFDVIESIYEVKEGDVLELSISEEKPKNLDEQNFCGHGYLVVDEKIGETVLSIWGIVFRFKPPLGLQLEQKYYLCFKKL